MFIKYYDLKQIDMPFTLPELPLNQESEANMLKKGQNLWGFFFMKSTNPHTIKLNNL